MTLTVVNDAASAVDQILTMLERDVVPAVTVRPGVWGYSRSSAFHLAQLFAPLGQPDERRVLDVGSGIGTTLETIFLLGWANVEGVEIVSEYVEVSRRLYPERLVSIGDAWAFDYSPFDIVYVSGIETDTSRQRELDAMIAAQLRPEAVLITPLRG